MDNLRGLAERSILIQDHSNDKYVQLPEDTHTPSSKKQIQLQGPRPPPLRVIKDSHKTKKPPLPPHAAAAPQQPPYPAPDDSGQQRQPVIIYSVSPKLIHVPVNDFMDVVQCLTKLHSDNKQTSGSEAISLAAKLASIEKTSPSEKERLRSAGNEAMTELEGVEVGQFPGILSPTPPNLGPIPEDFFPSAAAMQSFLHSLNTRTPFLVKKSGLGLTDPPKDEAWHSVVHMELADNKLSELPLSPNSPELKVLMLQGNVDLTRIPNTFFFKMPLLTTLDLSYTSVRELPDSLFELEQLREMYMKGCECFMKLSPKIGKLKKLEKLDLDGTQIIHMPEEIQELTNLQSLFLCFYEYRGRKGKQYTCSTIIPSKVISKLKGLKHLSIDVNPDDERWYENVQDILPEILGLEHLLTLSLYIPHLELLKFIPDHIFQVDFRFIVGRHMQRIISSTPSTCEAKFKQSGCSLKFVNGDDVPNEIKRLVRHSKALFLERHKTIKNLSKFNIINLEQLRICMLAECRQMQTVVDGRQSNRGNDIFSHLLYLYISHMKSLRSIWEGPMPPGCFFGMLKSLVLQDCPELTTVLTLDFLGNLSLLKELILKACPKVTTLISDGSFKHKGNVFLPKLRKIMLLHLPELITISNGCYIGPSLNDMAIYDCPKLQSLSKSELSSQTLNVIKGEIKWWDQLQWSKEEWGISQRPSKFDCIFSSIDNQIDIMTQFGNDGDDIDDDADMTQLQTLFEHPKQNVDRISRRTSPVSRRISDDGYNWWKYGQKQMCGSKNPKSYYKCTYVGCPAKKKVERSVEDRRVIGINYEGIHTHTLPLYNKSLHELQSSDALQSPQRSDTCSQVSCVTNSSLADTIDQRGKFDHISSSIDNQVDVMTQIGNDVDDIDDDSADTPPPQTLFEHAKQSADSFIRSTEVGACEASLSPKTVTEPKIIVQTRSDIDLLDDGFRWRKYGQKVVKGNPNPRSYYKCSGAGCNVRKHVERSSTDLKDVITTYEGKHNHDVPASRNSSHTTTATTNSMPLKTINTVKPNLFTVPGKQQSEEDPTVIDLVLDKGKHTHTSPPIEDPSMDYSQNVSSRWTESEVLDDGSNIDFASTTFCEDPFMKELYDSNADSVSSIHCSEYVEQIVPTSSKGFI